MTTLLSIIGVSAFLILEGRSLVVLIQKKKSLIAWGLGYPVGALLNAFLFFTLHLFGISFGIVSLLLAHAILLVLLLMSAQNMLRDAPPCHPEEPEAKDWTRLDHICIALLIIVFLTSALYALNLPSAYWDTFAHWSFRAAQALHMGFFGIEGVVQPQFPILLHSLQVLHTLIPGWGDTLANTGTFLLSISAYASIFLIIQKQNTTRCALLTLTLLTGIPLIMIHLRQGMGDIHVTAYILLSALFLHQALTNECHAEETPEGPSRSILLSAILVAAAAWTKYEGLYFGVLPWIAIVLFHAWLKNNGKRAILKSVLPAIVIAAPWPLYTIARGLPLSPHGSGSFSLHLEALPHIAEQLFALGTFGLHWWAIAIILSMVLWQERTRFLPYFEQNPILLWGLLALALLLFVYIGTDEVRGLIKRDNFSRAMLLPTLLLTMSLTRICCTQHVR